MPRAPRRPTTAASPRHPCRGRRGSPGCSQCQAESVIAGGREHHRDPVEPREVARDDEPELREDHDHRGRRPDRTAARRAGTARRAGRSGCRAPRRGGTTCGSRCACRLTGFGIGCVSWWYMRAVRSRHSRPPRILIMPAPNSRRNTSHQIATMIVMGGGWSFDPRNATVKQRLAEQHLPAEAVERLADVHDRQVAEPEREEHEHRHPRRPELRQADDDGCREHHARDRERHEAPVGVPPAEHARPAQPRREPQQLGHRQQPVLAEQRTELVQRREEGDERERAHPALQHLAGDLVVVRVEPVEPVHALTLRRRSPVE